MVKHRGIIVESVVFVGSVVLYPVVALASKLTFVVRHFFPQSSEVSDSTAAVLSRMAVVLTTLQNKLESATQEEISLRENAKAHAIRKDRTGALNCLRRAENKKIQIGELAKQIQLLETQRLHLENMQTTEDVVRSQQELADVMGRAKLSRLATEAGSAADVISDGTADLEDAREVLHQDLPTVMEDEELLAQLEEELMDEQLRDLSDPKPFKPPPGDYVKTKTADTISDAETGENEAIARADTEQSDDQQENEQERQPLLSAPPAC